MNWDKIKGWMQEYLLISIAIIFVAITLVLFTIKYY